MGSANGDGQGYMAVRADGLLSWLRYFGEELRLAREACGMSVRQLAAHTSYSYQQLANVETGRRTPSESFAGEVDAALGTDGRFTRLLQRVLAEALPDWFEGFVREESRATRVRTYQCQVVHGLLQTEEYARALIRAGLPRASSEQVEELVARRIARRAIFERPEPPHLWVVLDEAALHRAVGGPAVMAGQLRQLLKDAENPHVIIQVLPFSAGAHAATNGSFVLWSYRDRPDTMYMEGMYGDRVVQQRASLEDVRLRYEHLQAVALPQAQSADMIRGALERFTAAPAPEAPAPEAPA
jgi:transcriptional regulator with XRE-family HTH domain